MHLRTSACLLCAAATAVMLLFFSPVHARETLRQSVDACLLDLAFASTGEQAAVLGERCPELQARLVAEGWTETLDGIPFNQLTAAQLNTFIELTNHWRDTATPPAMSDLTPILDALDVSNDEEQSLLDQLKAWLAGLVPERTRNSFKDMLRRLLPDLHFEPATWSLIVDMLIALIVGGAIWIVVIEIARARRFNDGKSVPAGSTGTVGATPQATRLNPAEQPSWLFDRLLALVSDRFQRPHSSGLSHRQLETILPELTPMTEGHRQDLATFTRATERMVYGAWQPGPDDLDDIVTAGQQVLNGIEGKRP